MREALFIKRNAAKWEKYQQVPAESADEKADRFITLLDDLAYSRTFYPQSKVTRWINHIAAGIYQQIYQNKKERLTRLRTFWTHELPLVFYKHRKILLFTFCFFLFCLLFGVISSAKDPTFIKGILGEDYVAMTEENIEKGDPFGVYRDDDKFTMFVMIAINNIRVAFTSFVYGIFFGIGTLWIMFYNGIMVGAFEQMFFAKGLGMQSVLVIWIHGTIEILSIVVAGCAGLVMGWGFLFPGTYSRRVAFRLAVKDAIKIIISLVPFFLAAALLESYVTFQMSDTFSTGGTGKGLPLWAGAAILIVSVFIMIGFFVLLPLRRGRAIYRQQTLQSQTFLTLQPGK